MQPLNRVQAYGHVAQKYGLEESIFLDSIVYWYRVNRADNRNFHDGRWWTHNSISVYVQLFPWWSTKQIRRIINSCLEQGAIVSGNYNKKAMDRTLWYSPTEDLMAMYGDIVPGSSHEDVVYYADGESLPICPNGQMDEPESRHNPCEEQESDISFSAPICPNGQMQMPKRENAFAQTGQPIPCSTHVDTHDAPCSPPAGDDAAPGENRKRAKHDAAYKPDWFDALWRIYPRKDNRLTAIRAWDKLRPDRPTCRQMLAGLERDKASRQWQRDGGEYIPMLSTWINQRRWENQGVDLTQLPQAAETSTPRISWADDREVT